MILKHIELTKVEGLARSAFADDNYTLDITFPVKLLSLNKLLRLHYQARNNYCKDIYELARILTLRDRPKKPLKSAFIQIHRYAPRMFDFDGLVGAAKPFIDSLTHCGIIEDDKWSVTGSWFVMQSKCKEDESRLEISITGVVGK